MVTIKKVSEDSPHYNITFIKTIYNGEKSKESKESVYTISLKQAKNIIAHVETIEKLDDKEISLKEYMSEFHKVYKEVCESLMKTL